MRSGFLITNDVVSLKGFKCANSANNFIKKYL